jgi:SAM-dependent methyltransferase
MYDFLKSIFVNDFSKPLLVKIEPFLRLFLQPFFMGNAKYCNVCQTKLKTFVGLATGDALCPICGSLPRHRRLWQIIQNIKADAPIKILDFSPSRALSRKIKGDNRFSYFTSGFASDDFVTDFKHNLVENNIPANSYDVLICYHVLEHITDDLTAIKNLYRIVKQGGSVFIQTPFKDGEIYEDNTIQSPEQRKIHFGQADHVRIYTVDGLCQRLMAAGFYVEILHFENDLLSIEMELNPKEIVIRAKK